MPCLVLRALAAPSHVAVRAQKGASDHCCIETRWQCSIRCVACSFGPSGELLHLFNTFRTAFRCGITRLVYNGQSWGRVCLIELWKVGRPEFGYQAALLQVAVSFEAPRANFLVFRCPYLIAVFQRPYLKLKIPIWLFGGQNPRRANSQRPTQLPTPNSTLNRALQTRYQVQATGGLKAGWIRPLRRLVRGPFGSQGACNSATQRGSVAM